MPIYQLECECGHKKEEFEHKRKNVDLNCQVCKGLMKIVISASTIRFTNKDTIAQG